MTSVVDRASILAARARAFHDAPQREEAGFQAIFFRDASDRYALRIDQVEAVHPISDLAVVPGAPAFVRGAALLGGEILALIDLRILLGSARRGIEDLRNALVVGAARGTESRRFALLSSEVESIARVVSSSLRASPHAGVEDDVVESMIGDDRLLLSLENLIVRIQKEVS